MIPSVRDKRTALALSSNVSPASLAGIHIRISAAAREQFGVSESFRDDLVARNSIDACLSA